MTDDQGFTAEVAARAASLRFEDLPDDVVEVARQCILDWLGVTVAGARDDCADLVVQDMVSLGLGSFGATLVGRTERLPMLDAALVNGTASHALDYDDVNDAMLGHPSVPILAGLLGLAEHLGSSGEDLVCAFVAGYEAECHVGRATGSPHYLRGFHATGTIGTFGAAAACSRLMGLDADTTAVALGLAGAQAAGLKSMFGTMVKPLHAGKASENGLRAARLAARGYSAAADVLECEQGFGETHTDGFDADRGRRPARKDWFLLDNLFKYNAACFQTHSSIEGIRSLQTEHGFGADDVDTIVIEADRSQLRMCAIPNPVTGLEAKFSLRHTAAMVLAGEDTAAIDSFTDDAVAKPHVVKLRDRVEVRPGVGAGGATPVEVRLRDGRVLHSAHDTHIPADDLAEQRRRLLVKFSGLVGPVLGRDRAERLAGLAVDVDRLDNVADLLAGTVPPSAS